LSAVQSTTPTTRKTALNAVHRQMGAKMVDFNGWDMPVEYPSAGGIIAEHNAVRNGVGIFDVSHMGDIRLQGPEALAAVQHISMNDASRLAIGQAQYSALLYPQGTFVDDVIVHRLGEDDYLLVINAGTREKDVNWVRDNTRQFACKVEDLSDDFTQIAIQGPQGVNLLQKLTDANLSAVKFYWVTRGLHRRRRIRNLRPLRRSHQRQGLESGARSRQRIWRDPLRPGRAKYFAPRRRPLALRTRNFGYDQCMGSRTRSLLQNG
jgi:aminomethyltransferase